MKNSKRLDCSFVFSPRNLRGFGVIFLVVALLSMANVTEGSEGTSRNLQQEIGRMVMVGFRGLDVESDSPIVRQIRKGYVGGVILFDYDVPSGSNTRNVRSPSQVKSLIEELQSLTDRRLLIGVDQEGGRIQRLSPDHGFDSYPSHQELGNRNDTAYTYRTASTLAGNLHELGFNVNFAPVVDLNLNPENPVIGSLERSFGADPALVTRNARQFVRAHRRQDVMPVLKHFPGHGSSREDSHEGFVDVTDLWKEKELIPYKKLIEGGTRPAVMTAHLFNNRWDSRWPATLSGRTIGSILRDRLNYGGIVFSDDLQMGAIRKHYDRQTVLRRTLQAGVDVLVFVNNSVYEPRVAHRVVQTISKLIDNGLLERETILRSNRRIRRILHTTGN